MSAAGDEYHCRKCGAELSADEYGNGECEACVASREPWESESFYCDEEEEA
jgi:hypothetical protein